MAKAIAYGRLSHRSSMEHVNPEGNAEGLEMQEDNCRRYWQFCLEKDGVTWGTFVPDKAISARNKPFEKRPGGKLILDLLEPGDHLIVDKIDRLWRTMEDFVFLTKILENRQVTWHICNLFGITVRQGTSMGDFIIRMFVSLAEWESDRTSERNREIQAHLRANGRYAGNKPKFNSLFKIEKLYVREKQYQAPGNADPNLINLKQHFGHATIQPKETKR